MDVVNLTLNRLFELLIYYPDTGIFVWRVDRGSNKRAGYFAGCIHKSGYVVIKLDNRAYKASRLAFLYMTGAWPTKLIDHRDTDRSNNKWDNLREATNAQNKQNMRDARIDNLCGLLGVSKHGNRWHARIAIFGETRRHLGSFITREEAHAAYIAEKRKLHPFGTL